MIDNQPIVEKLKSFINQDKFSVYAWEDRGLNPSDDAISDRLQDLFNGCAENLIEAIGSNFNQKKLKRILRDGLRALIVQTLIPKNVNLFVTISTNFLKSCALISKTI